MNPAEVSDTITTIMTTAILLSNFVLMLLMWIDKAKQPNRTQDERIAQLEGQIENFQTYFSNDDKRIKAIEKGNKITQQALLALMSHAINGNDVDKLKAAKSALEDYLIER